MLKLCEALKVPKLLELIPYNSELYMMYKFVQYSWIRYQNEPLSLLDIVDRLYLDKENDQKNKEKNIILSSTIEVRPISPKNQ